MLLLLLTSSLSTFALLRETLRSFGTSRRICAVGLTARRVLLLQPGQNIPPPVAMKRNPETGELEEFHSHKLQDDLPEEEVRKLNQPAG